MRYLIVNADDFGACSGVNLGIVEAHRRGIVTSTSLMIDAGAAEEAARLAAECPGLGVGLHITLAPATDRGRARHDIEAQVERFQELLGRRPTHLDSHHHVHACPDLLPAFRDVCVGHGLPLRGYSQVRWCRRFYGQWGGRSHPEQISVASLKRILEQDLIDGITELSCHPGRVDPALVSAYTTERERELHTLCDVRLRAFLDRAGVALIHFGRVSPRSRPGVRGMS